MADTHAPTTGQRDWRRVWLYAVTVAMMLVSIKGQVESIESRMGGFAFVFAIANDVGAIIALDASLSAPRKSAIRRWAWLVILMAAGTGGALNVWHVSVDAVLDPDGKTHLPLLPRELAYLVGAEPIALVLVLSHLIGLVIAAKREAAVGHQQVHQPEHQPGTSTSPGTSAGPSAGAGALHQRTGEHQVTLVELGTSGTTGGHQAITIAAPAPAPAPALTPAPARPRNAVSAATTRPPAVSRRALEAVPVPRPEWLTDDQLDAVLRDIRAARAERQRYGRPRLMKEHGLNDPQAKALLAYIRDHRLLEAAS